MIDGAMAELASHNRFTVVLIGKETDGDVETGIRIDLAYSYSIVKGKPVSRIELLNMRGDALVSRIAGDGDRVWNYDVVRNQYSSSEYGTGNFIGRERERLFQVLAQMSDGAQTFVSRLLIDSFARAGISRSQWMPWRPSSTVSLDPAGNVVCESSTPSPSQLTYVLAKDPFFRYRLTSAKYIERSQISGRPRTIEWEATIYPDWIPKDTSYDFVPPKGSRPVSVSQAHGGG